MNECDGRPGRLLGLRLISRTAQALVELKVDDSRQLQLMRMSLESIAGASGGERLNDNGRPSREYCCIGNTSMIYIYKSLDTVMKKMPVQF